MDWMSRASSTSRSENVEARSARSVNTVRSWSPRARQCAIDSGQHTVDAPHVGLLDGRFGRVEQRVHIGGRLRLGHRDHVAAGEGGSRARIGDVEVLLAEQRPQADRCGARLGDLDARVDLEADVQRPVLGNPFDAGDGADSHPGHPDGVTGLESAGVVDDDGQGIGALEDPHAADGHGDEGEDDDDGSTDRRLEPQVAVDHVPPPSMFEKRALRPEPSELEPEPESRS